MEGALSHVRFEHPSWITESETQCHLCDCLFHGLHNKLWNSLHYLYDNPTVKYSQLTVAACKAELEYENESKTYADMKLKSAVVDDKNSNNDGTDQQLKKNGRNVEHLHPILSVIGNSAKPRESGYGDGSNKTKGKSTKSGNKNTQAKTTQSG